MAGVRKHVDDSGSDEPVTLFRNQGRSVSCQGARMAGHVDNALCTDPASQPAAFASETASAESPS